MRPRYCDIIADKSSLAGCPAAIREEKHVQDCDLAAVR